MTETELGTGALVDSEQALLAQVRRIADEVAAANAEAVDREARFPVEALDAPRVCGGALEVVGIMGYKNDSPYSIGRQLRDSLSARVMVANERIHATDAALLLIAKEA